VARRVLAVDLSEIEVSEGLTDKQRLFVEHYLIVFEWS
jgi:hypothetical protein